MSASGKTVTLLPAAASLSLCLDLEVAPSKDLVFGAFHEIASGVQRLREHALVSTRTTVEFLRSCHQNMLGAQVLEQALPFLASEERDLLKSQLRVSVDWLNSIPLVT